MPHRQKYCGAACAKIGKERNRLASAARDGSDIRPGDRRPT
jgi:hypothetical protein